MAKIARLTSCDVVDGALLPPLTARLGSVVTKNPRTPSSAQAGIEPAPGLRCLCGRGGWLAKSGEWESVQTAVLMDRRPLWPADHRHGTSGRRRVHPALRAGAGHAP